MLFRIIKRNEITNIMPSNILYPSPNVDSSFTIFTSAIGSTMLDINENTIVSIDNFIIGTAHIPTITKVPKIPTAFFSILLAPKTVSTASPKIFPTTGTNVDTVVFVNFEVTPSILVDKLPSNDIAPISTVNTMPKIHKLDDLKYFDNLSI